MPAWPATGMGKILLLEAVWQDIPEEKKLPKMHPASLAQCKDKERTNPFSYLSAI